MPKMARKKDRLKIPALERCTREITKGVGFLRAERRAPYISTLQVVDAALRSTLMRQTATCPPPVNLLSPAARPQLNRLGRRYPWLKKEANDKRTTFEWVRDVYRRWIPGLVLDDLREADLSLWRTLSADILGGRKPDWFIIPTKKENEERFRAWNPGRVDVTELSDALIEHVQTLLDENDDRSERARRLEALRTHPKRCVRRPALGR
jgi:hypothetical protein